MFHFRQALMRMRQGDSDREIAASKVMGRRKAAALRQVASARGWLGAAQALPEDAEIAQAMSAPRRAASTVSSLQPWRGLIGQWAAQGVSGVAMHSALKREHGFTGSYSAVRRLLADLRSSQPPRVRQFGADFCAWRSDAPIESSTCVGAAETTVVARGFA